MNKHQKAGCRGYFLIALVAGVLCCASSGRGQQTDCNSNGIPDNQEIVGPLSGFALQFDRIDDFVGVPGFGAIAPTSEITVEFWQKADIVAPQYSVILLPDVTTNRLTMAAPWSDVTTPTRDGR